MATDCGKEKLMKRNFYASLLQRKNGSIYIDRDYPREIIAYTLFILAIPIIFAAIVVFAIVAPSKTVAQRNENATVEPNVADTDDLPSIYPVQGRLTSNFGYRQSPFGRRSEF